MRGSLPSLRTHLPDLMRRERIPCRKTDRAALAMRRLRGASYGRDPQALHTLTAGLRRKIEKSPARPRYILTEVGVGYRLADE